MATTRLSGMAQLDSNNTEPKTILIVEDDPFIAMDLQDTFEEAGYTVLGPVAAVQPGLEIVAEMTPDIAMLDFNLGRETSLPIAEKLEETAVPYIFLSGHADKVVKVGKVSKKRIIAKPFHAESLVARVDRIINASRTRASLSAS